MHYALFHHLLNGLPTHGDVARFLTGIHVNPEEVRPGSLFLALAEEGYDGHHHLQEAAFRGAAAAVVDRTRLTGLPAIPTLPLYLSADTTRLYGNLATAWRETLPYPIVAVTGSTGKTTTKDLAAAALDGVKTQGNQNNLHGTPYTLLNFPADAAAGVVEIGTSQPGEIPRLTEIVRPDIGVITNVGPTHLEGLGSVAAVAREKGALFAGLPPHGTAIINGQDAWAGEQLRRFRGRRVVSFCQDRSAAAEVAVEASGVPTPEGRQAGFRVGSHLLPVRLQHPARCHLANAAAALAVAHALGVDLQGAAARMATVPISASRILKVGQAHLIDDTYNSNPRAVEAAIHTLLELGQVGSTAACLGEMAELGDQAEELHAELGRWLAHSGLHKLVTVGDRAASIAQAARQAGMGEVHAADTPQRAAAHLSEWLGPDCWLLVKGSRVARLERIVAALGG